MPFTTAAGALRARCCECMCCKAARHKCICSSAPLLDAPPHQPVTPTPSPPANQPNATEPSLQINQYRQAGVNPLVLFSGDCFNPSLMSTMTHGKQMVPILNEMGVQVRGRDAGGGRRGAPALAVAPPVACTAAGQAMGLQAAPPRGGVA